MGNFYDLKYFNTYKLHMPELDLYGEFNKQNNI